MPKKITVELSEQEAQGLCDILQRYQEEAKDNPYLKYVKLAKNLENLIRKATAH